MSRVTDERLAALIADSVPQDGDEPGRATWHALLDLRDLRPYSRPGRIIGVSGPAHEPNTPLDYSDPHDSAYGSGFETMREIAEALWVQYGSDPMFLEKLRAVEP